MVATRSSSSNKDLLPPLPSHPPRKRKRTPTVTIAETAATVADATEDQQCEPTNASRRQCTDDNKVSFESFPYYLSDLTKQEICACAYVHLVRKKKVPRNLSSISQSLLLSDGSEVYHETLAKAVANEFDTGLLAYDPSSTLSTFDRVCELVKIASVYRKLSPVVVFLSSVFVADIEKSVTDKLQSKLDSMPDGVLVIGSCLDEARTSSSIFPTRVTVRMPRDESQASRLRQQFELDRKTLNARRNVDTIRRVLDDAGWECRDVEAISVKDKLLTEEWVGRMIGFAISHHIKNKGSSEDCQDVLFSESIIHGFDLLTAIDDAARSSKKSLKDVVTENEYEKRLLAEVVVPNELGVTFDDVGALDNVKDVLREAVMLPLQRPELFSKGQLTKPCRGILLFGPPGTGKTMLAKAIATEAGANFINISTSSITSKWYSESEKYVKAVFTLASKVAPSVIFIDEVDSLLSSRKISEHDITLRMKNEFMMNWDGLRTKDGERVLVLGATNRPFALDEAVLRRFSRRLMIGMPDSSNREKILRVILSKEELAPDVDLADIANMTEGYSGSDLKNLCIVAAHRPIQEVLGKEKREKSSESRSRSNDIRPLEMNDFICAHKLAGSSTSSTSASMRELLEWNDKFGEGGSREKQVLTYFL